jgi:hypothetical protein
MAMPGPNTGVQTSYGFDMAVAFAGQLANNQNYRAVSGNLEGALNIPFGVGLKKGAADDGYATPTLVGDLIEGIAVHTHALDTIGLSGLSPATAGIQPKEMFTVLRSGEIYVLVEEAVVAHGPVYCRYAAGAGGTILGSFRTSADTATAGLVKGAKYLTSAAAGGIAKLSFDANAAAT